MLYDREPDFEAEIRILTEAQGGRRTPPLQGIRWDFRYADDASTNQVYMIHPLFLDVQGNPLAKGTPLDGTLRARMFIVVDDMRTYHFNRLRVGTEFHCVEGKRPCATGKVTGL